ncbi:zinc ribbon domain-containing protein [Halapricum desulfuricans]|uniref:Zn-ribbon domain containing protein n=1 Tax=Halapricum desulfuricans TaxID=2841257 RepID=A0A897NYH9_9EURY|nr:zinc ribbon domain-containing protein [Halapricum desulfuricans]QSG15793.1 Zn-ribbon domain containing protein [Halapricum desulfuricans]
MSECPYCGGPIAEDDRYCPRCGERQTDRGDREGFLDPAVVQYLDGIRNGARTFDPDSPYHDRFEREVAAAIGDFAHLLGAGVDLHDVLTVDQSAPIESPVDPVEADPATRQLLGLAVLLGLATESFSGVDSDELLASYHELQDRD